MDILHAFAAHTTAHAGVMDLLGDCLLVTEVSAPIQTTAGVITTHGSAIAGATVQVGVTDRAGATVTETIPTGTTTTTQATTATTVAVVETTTATEMARIMATVRQVAQEAALHQTTTEVATRLQIQFAKMAKQETSPTSTDTEFPMQRQPHPMQAMFMPDAM